MDSKLKKSRYKSVEGKHWIEVRVKDSQRLFDHRDPAPFREKELDERFVEYIYSSAREFSITTPLKIIIYIEENESESVTSATIREAIQSHFSYQIELQAGNLKQFWKRAQFFLLIGILVLIVCLGSAQSLTVPLKPGLIGIFRDGLIIFGWVSVWKPIEVILFDWYPPFERLRFYKKMRLTEMDIQFGIQKTPVEIYKHKTLSETI